LRRLLASLETGSFVKPTRLTVGEYLEQWCQSYVIPNTAPTTADGYGDIIHKQLIPHLGHLPLTQLEANHIRAYYARQRREGRRDGKGPLAAKTIKNHHRVLSLALKHAVKDGLLVRNVAEAVDPPRCEDPNLARVSPEDVHRLLEAARETPHYVLLYAAAYTGLRRSELLGLRWRDVDLDFATLSVTRTLHHVPKVGYVVKEPKTASSRRCVDLTPDLALLLRRHREEQEAVREFLGGRVDPDDLVFATAEGKPLPPNSVTKGFRRLADSLGLNGVRFHDQRHGHATILLRQGVHPKVVQERLGHASINITLDTYSHVLPGLQAAAAMRFDEAMREARNESHRRTDTGALGKDLSGEAVTH
jgi:integrase